MKTNIFYDKQVPYVTDKETLPEKPQFSEPPFQPHYKPYRMSDEEMEHQVHVARNKMEEWQMECSMANEEYNQAVADFIRDCTPIVEEDQEKVKEIILKSYECKKDCVKKDQCLYVCEKIPSEPVDHTIYKVELEMEECEQIKRKTDKEWFTCTSVAINKNNIGDFEYRRAFKIVETKEESQGELLNELIVQYNLTDTWEEALEIIGKRFHITRKI